MSDDEFDLDSENLSGSQLRQKLEAAIAQNKELREKVAVAEASTVITNLGLKHVAAKDLIGVSSKELESKAKELDAQKQAEKDQFLKDALAARGLDGDQLDAALAALTDPVGQVIAEQNHRQADLARAGGTPLPKREIEGLSGGDLILAGLEAKRKKS